MSHIFNSEPSYKNKWIKPLPNPIYFYTWSAIVLTNYRLRNDSHQVFKTKYHVFRIDETAKWTSRGMVRQRTLWFAGQVRSSCKERRSTRDCHRILRRWLHCFGDTCHDVWISQLWAGSIHLYRWKFLHVMFCEILCCFRKCSPSECFGSSTSVFSVA